MLPCAIAAWILGRAQLAQMWAGECEFNGFAWVRLAAILGKLVTILTVTLIVIRLLMLMKLNGGSGAYR